MNSILQVGIRIYIPPKAKTRAEINAYIEPTGSAVSPQLLQTARETASLLTYLAPFSYRANRDGSLTPMPLDGLPQIASQNNTTLMMVITNIEGEGFSGELAGAILSNPDIQDTLIDNIIATARQTGNIFSDAHFDFEFIPVDLRQQYSEFLAKAVQRLHAEGMLVSAALAPKTSATQPGQWYEAHSYGDIGAVVDFVVIMTYEWGSGRSAHARFAYRSGGTSAQYALTEMPATRL